MGRVKFILFRNSLNKANGSPAFVDGYETPDRPVSPPDEIDHYFGMAMKQGTLSKAEADLRLYEIVYIHDDGRVEPY